MKKKRRMGSSKMSGMIDRNVCKIYSLNLIVFLVIL